MQATGDSHVDVLYLGGGTIDAEQGSIGAPEPCEAHADSPRLASCNKI